jgi:hypothetical protein
MKVGLTLAGLVFAASTVAMEKGLLLSMDSSPCGVAEKGSKTVAGQILGTDGEHK